MSLAAPGWSAGSEGAGDAEQSCRVAGLPHETVCGRVVRPLDPTRPAGVRIDVHYLVVPALARRKQADPVFLIAGGPGQSAIGLASQVMPVFQRLNRRRDIVFVDQRGTGRSAPLDCGDDGHLTLKEHADLTFALARLERCRRALEALPHGDLRFFATPLAMADLDAVRARLGAERINIVAASYGTRAALDYLRQFPQRARRLVLDGVAPPDMALPASMSRDSETALQSLFGACEREPQCASRHPRLRTDWAALLGALPREVSAAHPLTGRIETFTLSREMLLRTVRQALYVPSSASALPAAISAASAGRYEALFGLAGRLQGNASARPALGMHLSVICTEDVPLLAQHRAAAPGESFGDAFARFYEQACAAWPRGELPAGYTVVPRTQAAVLMFSGGLDPVTPPRHADRVMKALGPRARHVTIPQAGHGALGIGCMGELLHRFIDEGNDDDALAVDADCAVRVPRPRVFLPISDEAVR